MLCFHSILLKFDKKSCIKRDTGKHGRASGMLYTQPEVYMRDRHPFRPQTQAKIYAIVALALQSTLSVRSHRYVGNRCSAPHI